MQSVYSTDLQILTVIMPVAMGAIMLGLGLSLQMEDFRQVARYPKPIWIGLSCQLILLPILAFIIVHLSDLTPALGLGLILLAAAPGGPSSNLYSHLAGGDVALNISLTAVNSILSIATLPLLVNIGIHVFISDGSVVPLQVQKVLEVFAIIMIPVSVGMWIRSKWPSFADFMKRPVKIASAVFLALLIVIAAVGQWSILEKYFWRVGFYTLLFNVLNLLVGYFVPRWFKISHSQAIAIGMEIGIHNGTLAIFVALSILNNATVGIPAAIYSIMMFLTASIFGVLVNKLDPNVRNTSP